MTRLGRIWLTLIVAVMAISLVSAQSFKTVPGKLPPAPILQPKLSTLDNTAQSLPFSQDWTNTGLITVSDDWSGVPGITGYLGDSAAITTTGIDPQTLLSGTTGFTVDAIANLALTTSTSGGVAEFEIANPTVALQGSGTADFPFILISINTTGMSNIRVQYNLRDVDAGTDNAVQPVALQYRVGTTGNFTNVAAAFVADASTGPSLATLVTAVDVVLPSAVDNQALVQLRVITSNAASSDEWIGIDDIYIDESPPTVDGDGTATLSNNSGGALNGTTVFPRNTGSQTVAITVTGLPTGALATVSVDIPSGWTGLNVGNVSLSGSGFGSASAGVAGNVVTISSAAVTDAATGIVTIAGLTTPNPTNVTDNGNYSFVVKTAVASGTLTAITTSPTAYVTIPIANLRDQDGNGVPLDANTTVAISGVATVPSSISTTQLTVFIQDATGGMNIFKSGAPPTVTEGNEYTVKGQVTQFNGLTEVSPATMGEVYDLGASSMPAYEPVAMAVLKASPEDYEGKYIAVQNVTISSGTWGANGLVYATGGSDSVGIFIDTDTDLDENIAPGAAFDVKGVWTQNDAASPYVGDFTTYRVMPLHFPTDFAAANTLPVQLSAFTAAASGLNASLRWTTASEVDNAGWEVERRNISKQYAGTGRWETSWMKIGFVEGAGTSTSAREYRFIDDLRLTIDDSRLTSASPRFAYRLKQLDRSGSFSYSHEAEVEVGATAKEFRLGAAYPNPFNPATSVEFSLAAPGVASLKVYNVLGQEVATLFNGAAEAGRLYRATWDASSMPSGMYFARLESGNAASMKRLMLVK